MLTLLTLLACSRDPQSLSEVDVWTSPDRPGVARLQWTSTASGRSFVDYEVKGEARHTPLSEPGLTHEVWVLGLEPGVSVQATAITQLPDQELRSEPVTLKVPSTLAPALNLVSHSPEQTCGDGYVVLTAMTTRGESWIGIIDREGDWVWAERAPLNTFPSRVKPSLDGQSLVWINNDIDRSKDIGELVTLSLNGQRRTTTRALNAHHDFVEHQDGTLAWLGYDFREGMEVEGAQLDVAADAIYRAPIGASLGEEAVIYNTFDDYPPGVWDTGTTFDEGHFLEGWHEFGHGNSLMYLGDSYYVMYRWLDALVKIDALTGTYQWQLGGPDNEFTGDPSALFNHGHMSDLWEGGLLVFDNADNTGAISGVVEYALDEDAMTFEEVWSYRSPEDRLEILLGDAQRLPCDNVLIAWSSSGKLTEVTRQGEVVWEVQAEDLGWILSRVTFVTDLYDLRRAQSP